MSAKEIFEDYIRKNNKEDIIFGASRDYDSTIFGYVLGSIKDNYNISKWEAYPIAEEIVKIFNLE